MIKIGVYDIESDGFLNVMTQIHVLVIEDFETGALHTFRSDIPGSIKEGVELLSKIPLIVGQNILDFDIPAIKKLYPWFKPCGGVFDTLPAVRTIWSDIKSSDFALARKGKLKTENIGRHSLSAWGERLGLLKGDYGKTTDWSKLDEDMVSYCQQDVRVTSKLYHLIKRKEYPDHVLKMEQEIHRICLEQTAFGFPFDVQKANKLLGKLLVRKAELSKILQDSMGPGWIQPLGEVFSKRTVKYKDILRGNETAGCPWTKVKFIEFNPNSRAHLTRQLQIKFGWKPDPEEYGADNIPNLDNDILKKLKNIPVVPTISEFLMIEKRLGTLSEGRQSWLNKEVDGKIHGRVNTMGAITARCTHSDPNLAQIPANKVPYGRECRELFIPPKGWKQFGSDVAGLELRMLAHYMAKFDNGAYGKIVLEGDVHETNRIAAGLDSRDVAKTFCYAFLYGSGNENLGLITGRSKAGGEKLKDQFLNNIPALKTLREAVSDTSKRTKQLRALDGRYIPVRHAHASLNTLLQSAGAIVCKQWVVRMHELLKERGYTHGIEYKQAAFIHDEIQIHFDPNLITGEILGEISKQAIEESGNKFNVRLPLAIDWKVGNNYAECH